jgi:hypothetical protein
VGYGRHTVTKRVVGVFVRFFRAPMAVVSAEWDCLLMVTKAIVEMQFADFVSTGSIRLCNLLAKSHYRWLEKQML